jgi:hypothetical protein
MQEDQADFDVFISHATEDKNSIARPLANQLERYGLRVWFDEAVLVPGVSLSSAIDAGLYQARFGVVILSPSFFSKNWPKYELSGLKARQLQGEQILIPIWHGVSLQQVTAFSPPLADMVALDSNKASLDEIAEHILHTVRAGEHSRWLVQVIRTALTNLDSTEHHLHDFDYWPDGGLRTLYSHLMSFATYPQLAAKFGASVWLKGPHSNSRLDLHNQSSFGWYNPRFVEWIANNIRYVISNPAFCAMSSNMVEKYLRNLLFLYYASYNMLRCNPRSRERLLQGLLDGMEQNTLQPQYYWNISWINHLDPQDPITKLMVELDEMFDSNLASSAIYFWIRREIDGTAPIFFGLAVDMLNAYFPAYFTNFNFRVAWYHETET